MPVFTFTPAQSKAARALINVTSEEVRLRAGLGQNTLQRFEQGRTKLNMTTVEKLIAAFEDLGVTFPDADTVRKIPPARAMDRAA